jgi:type I restriction enzyme S subunit
MIKVVEIGKCCEIVSGSTPSRIEKDYWGGNINWTSIKDLSNLDDKFIFETSEKITESGFKSCSTNLIPINSLLLSSRAPIGHLAINKVELCTNQGFKSLIPNKDVDVNYLYYSIKRIVPKLKDLGNGATFKELSKSTLSKVAIPLPPLETQQRIATILDAADTLRKKTQQIIDSYDELAQSIFLDMFGDPVKNPKGWEKSNGEEYCKRLKVGVVIRPASYYVENGVIALRSLNIKPHRIDLKDLVFFSREAHENVLSKSVLHEGDVVIVRTGSTGIATVIPKELDGCNCIDLIIVSPKIEVINPFYLTYFFNSERGKSLVSGIEVGGIQKHFNIGAVKKLLIPIPPISLQTQFAEKIALIDQQKELAKQSLKESEDLFNTLLQKAFKGELV